MRLPIIAAAVLIGLAAGAAQAEHASFGRHNDAELFQGLSLTDAQRDQVRAIEKSGWTQARSTMQQMRTLHEQVMSRLLSPGSVSEADLAPLVQQEQALRAQIDQQRLAAALQMRQVLTPAQLAQAAAKHQQLESLHEQEHQLMQPASAE